jgi:hypothetical protein
LWSAEVVVLGAPLRCSPDFVCRQVPAWAIGCRV